jgi:hypothetical protein
MNGYLWSVGRHARGEGQGKDLVLIDPDIKTTNRIESRLPAIPEQLGEQR